MCQLSQNTFLPSLMERMEYVQYSAALAITFEFQGVNIFNKVPSKLQSETSILKFKSCCKFIDFDF